MKQKHINRISAQLTKFGGRAAANVAPMKPEEISPKFEMEELYHAGYNPETHEGRFVFKKGPVAVIVKLFKVEELESANKSLKPVYPVSNEMLDTILAYHNTVEALPEEYIDQGAEVALAHANNMSALYNDIISNRDDLEDLSLDVGDDDVQGGFRVTAGDKGLVSFKLKPGFISMKIVTGTSDFLAVARNG